MKNLTICIAVIFITLNLQGQADWQSILLQKNQELVKINSHESMDAPIQVIERVANSVNDDYLPAYYAAFWNIQKFWISKNECETCIDVAEKYIEKAMEIEENNSELYTLKGYLMQAKINISPMSAPFISSKAQTALDKAIALDATNPRAVMNKGQLTFYTPTMFGGGKDNAMPYFTKARELFDAVEVDSTSLKPSWGRTRMGQLEHQMNSGK